MCLTKFHCLKMFCLTKNQRGEVFVEVSSKICPMLFHSKNTKCEISFFRWDYLICDFCFFFVFNKSIILVKKKATRNSLFKLCERMVFRIFIFLKQPKAKSLHKSCCLSENVVFLNDAVSKCCHSSLNLTKKDLVAC